MAPRAHCKLRKPPTRAASPAPGSRWIPAPNRSLSPDATGLASIWTARWPGTMRRAHFLPPYPLGEPIPEMIAMVKSLLAAGVTVKIFSARACEPESIPIIQAWAEKHGLGRTGSHQPEGLRPDPLLRRPGNPDGAQPGEIQSVVWPTARPGEGLQDWIDGLMDGRWTVILQQSLLQHPASITPPAPSSGAASRGTRGKCRA